jgi:hypothetical protein
MMDIIQFVLIFGLIAYAILAAVALVVAPLNLGVLDRFFDRILSPWV